MRVLISDPGGPLDRVLRGVLPEAGHAIAAEGPLDVVILSILGAGGPRDPLEVRNRLQQAFDRGARRAILVSSIESAGPRPIGAGPLFEGSPERPAGPAGEAALLAEKAALERRNALGMSLVILRAGQLYGDGEPGCLLPFVEALRTGTRASLEAAMRSPTPAPTHVEDVARAAALAVEAGDWVYHVTPDPPPAAVDIVQALIAADPDLASPTAADVLRTSRPESGFPYPPHRAIRELSFAPRWNVARGARAALGQEVDRADFRFEQSTAGSTVLEEEARFWDQQELVEKEMARRPHDWAFDAELGNVIQAPTYRFMKSVFERHRPATVLDVGCGSGVYSRYMARYGGIRVVGVDLSPAKIAKAIDLARAEGVGDLVDYRVANALEFAVDRPVDAICAFGALHHLPDVERHLPAIVERNLKPGGFIIAAEPFHEGYHPMILRFMSWIGRSRWRRFFDVDRYEEIAGAAERGATIFGESPAGLEHHESARSLDDLLRTDFETIAIRYTQLFAPFFANAFVIYQRSPRIRSLARRLVPAVVRLDSLLCRFRRYSRWAALGLYAVRPRSVR